MSKTNLFTKHPSVIRAFIVLLLLGLFIDGNIVTFSLVCVMVFLFMTARAFMTPSKKRVRFFLILAYAFLMSVQLAYCAIAVFSVDSPFIVFCIKKIFATLLILFPYGLERLFTIRNYTHFYVPSAQELSMYTFHEIKENTERIRETLEQLNKSGRVLSPENLSTLISDLPRHDSFRYINNGNLTEEYFALAEESFSDPHVYIVISNTGSPASEMISLFTGKQYNHVSLAFDDTLKTIISYNGGEKLYPPGMNREMLEYFNKKEDSSIMVYRIRAGREQKKRIVDKVREINREGSAYNLIGLVTKHSHKPNIMFCSQFVYKMLKYAGLAYFNKKETEIRPTDFVELDYRRQLEFVYELRLNT
ncbi:MAG: hypothetical protein LBT26_00880 [Clostridiales Family XIII bacterium]|jgi:hypothetical protein|nr:hypothetical protein [Clostridiales Family XIII bacterium]